jgi:hypothetical protein
MSFHSLYGQTPYPVWNTEKSFNLSTRNVTELIVLDSAIQKQIEQYANFIIKLDSTFENYGYLKLKIKPNNGNVKSSNKCYVIFPSLAYEYSDRKDEDLPLFYSYIGKRLVLIYIEGIKNTNESSRLRKKIAKMVNKTLPKLEEHKIKNPQTGKIIKLRPTGGSFVDTERTFCID